MDGRNALNAKKSDENGDCRYSFTEWGPCKQMVGGGCARVRTVSNVDRVYPGKSCYEPNKYPGYPLELATETCKCS